MSGVHGPTVTRQNHVASRPGAKRAVRRRLQMPARRGATRLTAPAPDAVCVGAPAVPARTGAQAASHETAVPCPGMATATGDPGATCGPDRGRIHGASPETPSHA